MLEMKTRWVFFVKEGNLRSFKLFGIGTGTIPVKSGLSLQMQATDARGDSSLHFQVTCGKAVVLLTLKTSFSRTYSQFSKACDCR